MPPLRIFISYGRDQYAPLAARLAADLTEHGYGVVRPATAKRPPLGA